ncbi:MAG: endonuclease/exonuclease/phosphatase (EEP) superfamily protein YafD [Ulvibacter sp.]|jgi:endonuclease/exonuclease/phosphatase (EEP) superfamily protein YafD
MKILFLKKLTWILIVGVLFTSILPNIVSNYWLIDIFSNFKLQYLIISIFLLFISLFFLNKKILAVILLIISMLWNSYFIAPYYFSDITVLKSKKEVKISSINLLSSNSETDLVKNYIFEEDPDILILMEFTQNWQIKLNPIINNYQYKRLVVRNDNFGIALLSKYEMNSSIDYFDLNDKPSIVADLNIESYKISLVATHPNPPINQLTFENRNKQLSNILNKRSKLSKKLIIAGDFNTSSFSNHFSKLTNGDLKDSRIGFGLLPTWPANYLMLQTTLDHFLVSKNLEVIDRSTGKNIGSDHLPINIIIGVN